MNAITVENVSKRYLIDHQARSDTLRDALAHGARGLWNRLRRGSLQQEEFWALRDVSFEVKPGEVIGIIGRNGAGKSTLLKILSRITEPSTGRIELRGRVASLLEVGTGFHPELSGRENIYLNGAILGMSRAEITRKFDEIVAFAEIERFLDTPVKRYSSGMYVRLAFAVAAHLEPEILIVDEVLAVGDAAFQRKCLGKMQDVARAEGRTVLFVSHNMTAIANLCRQAVLLEKGTVKDRGETSAVIATYLQTQSAYSGETAWPDPERAPGNADIRLHRIRLITPGAGHEPPSVHSPVDVEVVYWNRLDGCEQNVSILINTITGICVLNTYSPSRAMPAGLVAAVCHLPGDFLNDETYQMDVLIVKDTSVILYRQTEALTFTVSEGQRAGNWHGKHAGVVRPKLPWNFGPLPHQP